MENDFRLPTDLTPVACRGCDLLQRIPTLPRGGRARCPRCDEIIAVAPIDSLERPFALTMAAAIVFVTANVTPLMGLSAAGREVSTTLMGGAEQMWLQGHEITAAMVAFCAVIAPGCYIGLLLILLFALRRPPAPSWVGAVLRWAALIRPWSMSEVMMLGILVALTKIAQLASVIPGIAMFAVGALIVLLARIMMDINPRDYWQRVEWAERPLPSAVCNMAFNVGKTP